MSVGVQALRNELLLDARIPEILDLIIGTAGQVLGYLRPPVAQYPVDVDNGSLLLLRKRPSLEVRPQIVYPPQSTTLPTPL